MCRRRRRGTLAGVLLCAALLVSCSAPRPLDDTRLGLAEGLQVVAPGFEVEASPVFEDGRIQLELRAALSPADLVFVLRDEDYHAVIPLSFRVRERQGRELYAGREVTDSLTVATVEETRSDERMVFSERFDVEEGRVLAEVSLRDVRGEVRATRRAEAEMPPASVVSGVLPPRLMRGDSFVVGPRMSSWRLQDEVHILTSSFGPGDDPAIEFALLRGLHEVEVPTPPHWINPTRGSLTYRGAVFIGGEVDTVMVVTDAPGEIALPLLEEGVYIISTGLVDEQRAANRQRRPLIVLPADHPRVEAIDDLVEALAYIAYPSEVDVIQAAPTATERRERFDAFWASLFDVRAIAEQTMRLYYSRVEEANRLFTSHKPGWKTDRGMIYVVFGPPELVDRTLDGEVWHYGRGEAYTFLRVTYDGARWPLDHHVLQRSPRYEDAWQRAIRRWRRGNVR